MDQVGTRLVEQLTPLCLVCMPCRQRHIFDLPHLLGDIGGGTVCAGEPRVVIAGKDCRACAPGPGL